MQKRTAFVLIAFLLASGGSTECAPQPSSLDGKLASAFGTADAQKVMTSIGGALSRFDPADAIPAGTGLQCLADLQAAKAGDSDALRNATEVADWLVDHSEPLHNGVYGWTLPPIERETRKARACGAPGGHATFDSGTCNAPGTVYTYHTGLALTCLAKMYQITHNEKYLTVGRNVANSSWNEGAQPPGCNNCFFYWYSYDKNDVGRYVRNANVLMGMGMAALYQATNDPRYRERAQEIANTERAEVAAGNFGYFGIADERQQQDPQGEHWRIENHLPYVAMGLSEIGRALNEPSAIADADAIMKQWINCSNAICGRRTCAQWGANYDSCMVSQTAAPCFFLRDDPFFQQRCQGYLDRASGLNPYQIWSVLHGVNE
jgi:hypothetical protein